VLRAAGDRVVVLKPGAAELWDDGFPYLRSIDGRPVADLIGDAAGARELHSKTLRTRRLLRDCEELSALRRRRGWPESPRAVLELESEDRSKSKALEVRLGANRKAGPRPGPRAYEIREGGIGYLCTPEMEDGPEFVAWLQEAMAALGETKALIIDVRGNRGGSRDALLTLFPWFLSDADAPRIANVAAYRLGEGEPADAPEGYLADRYLHPASWPGWSAEARTAIAAFAPRFRPDWELPAGGYSAWHYLVLERPKSGAPKTYTGRVAILMNDECFSATDVFLGAFRGWRNVTLVGTPSSGGSGRVRDYALPHSGIRLSLTSMVSFLPDGSRFDGRGVAPDVLIESTATDLIGKSDTVLDAALRLLR
jgi:hypothetical protein